jgi:hypothetical protein
VNVTLNGCFGRTAPHPTFTLGTSPISFNKEVKMISGLLGTKVNAARPKIVSIVIATLISGLLVSNPIRANAATQNVNCGTSGYFVIIDNVVSNDSTGATQCKGSVLIPNTATSIASSAFANNTFVTTLSIPGSVTTIGNDSFKGLSSLTSITLGEGIVTIGDYAFQDSMSRVTSLTLPNSVQSVGRESFEINVTSGDPYALQEVN